MTANTVIKMSEKDIKALPKDIRKKALKTIESYKKFMKIVEQLQNIDLSDTDIEITAYRPSPSGMVELRKSDFSYSSKTKTIIF